MRDTAPGSILIDAAEFSRMLAISKPTLWRLKERGSLPPAIALTSQCIRWRRDIVLEWLERGCPPQTNNGSNAVTSEPSKIVTPRREVVRHDA